MLEILATSPVARFAFLALLFGVVASITMAVIFAVLHRSGVRQELRQKGVADDIISQALHDLDSESSAYRAGLAQARRLENLDQRTFRQKLGGFLLRRGFAHDVVWPVVDQLWTEARAGVEQREEESGRQ